MLFSCKITTSILIGLERKGIDVTSLLEGTALPEEFLKDPSYWLRAQDMEKFLEATVQISRQSHQDENILQSIAHATPELRSWGVLDSVLRMMTLQDVVAQPARFLSYFVSPEPPLDNIVRGESSIALDLPIPSDQFPFTTAYLKASFETLPLFSGRPLAQCSWEGIHLRIDWNSAQNNIFTGAEDPGHQISPELMRSIVAQLETHQLELQQRNAELEARNDQLRKAYLELESEMSQKLTLKEVTRGASDPGFSNRIESYDNTDSTSLMVLKDQVARLGDYMVRAQQLITLLVGQNRLQPGVKEAMKRVDWDWVKQQFPITMASCFELLRLTKEKSTAEKSHHKQQDSHQENHHV